jgi:hypothetical protein
MTFPSPSLTVMNESNAPLFSPEKRKGHERSFFLHGLLKSKSRGLGLPTAFAVL